MKLADLGSERAVLSGLCQYGRDALVDTSDIIGTNSFTDPTNQMLYKCMVSVLEDSNNIDLSSIIATSQRLHYYDSLVKDKKDLEFLRSIFNFPILLENVRGYAKRLAKLDFARKARVKLKEAYDKLEDITGNETIDYILNIPESASFELIQELNNRKEDKPKLIWEGGDELLQNLIDNPNETIGIPTDWAYYNEAIGGGFRRGGVNIIGARAKAGKTTLAKEVALHLAIGLGIPVLMLDTEMSKNDQFFRSLASLSKIPINHIENGSFGSDDIDKQKVLSAYESVKESRFYYESVSGRPFDEILSIIRRWIIREVGYDENGNTNDCLVIYDYFKIMDEGSISESVREYQALGFQLSKLNDFTKAYDFPCLSFVQLNRQLGISQSDRLIWYCHSYSQFLKKTDEELSEHPEYGNRKMVVEYCRFGSGTSDTADYINLGFDGEIAKVVEIGLNSQREAAERLDETGLPVVETEDNSTFTLGQD